MKICNITLRLRFVRQSAALSSAILNSISRIEEESGEIAGQAQDYKISNNNL